jgi:competence protein ComEC
LLAFHQYSPYALFANLLVLPFVPLAMMFTFIAGLAGLLVPSIAPLVGLPAAIILRYSIRVINYIANLPNAKMEVTFSVIGLIASYMCLIAGAVYLWKKTKHKFRDEPVIS